jgi:hypothetical protein
MQTVPEASVDLIRQILALEQAGRVQLCNREYGYTFEIVRHDTRRAPWGCPPAPPARTPRAHHPRDHDWRSPGGTAHALDRGSPGTPLQPQIEGPTNLVRTLGLRRPLSRAYLSKRSAA